MFIYPNFQVKMNHRNCVIHDTYIIQKSRGQWDDYKKKIVCVTTSERRANILVNTLVELQKFNESFWQQVKNEFEVVYDSQHVQGVAPTRPEPPSRFREVAALLSTGKNGMTNAQRDLLKQEFKQLQIAHMKNVERYGAQSQEHCRIAAENHRAREAARTVWIDTVYNPPAELSAYIHLLKVKDNYDWEFDVESAHLID